MTASIQKDRTGLGHVQSEQFVMVTEAGGGERKDRVSIGINLPILLYFILLFIYLFLSFCLF